MEAWRGEGRACLEARRHTEGGPHVPAAHAGPLQQQRA